MKGKFRNQYRSKAGNVVFVFTVTGSAEQLEAYKKAQGDNYREDEETKAPLYFTTNYTGDNIKLVLNRAGDRVLVDNSDIEKAVSMSKQLGGNLGQEIAKLQAKQILGITTQDDAPATVATPAATGAGLGAM